MTSSDSRSALPHFVGFSAYRVRRSQSTCSVRPTKRSHCWGGDGSLLFPRRLSHHSTSLTPPGSSGLHFQALHPFHRPSPDRARLGSRLLPCGHSITTRQTSL